MWALKYNINTIINRYDISISNPPVFSEHNKNQKFDDRVFGHVIQSSITTGDNTRAGTDVSVIQIDKRFPNSGLFPFSTEASLNEIGYSTKSPPCYHGKIERNVENWRYRVVIKYGSVTRWTKCLPILAAGCIKRQSFSPLGPLKYTMYNLIEIKSFQNSDFVKHGDSGSTVFYRREKDNELVAVGLVTAVTTYGSTIVTPIDDCLRELGLDILKNFERFLTYKLQPFGVY